MSDDIRKLKGNKGGTLLFAGIFALCFGGVGAFASWVIGKTLWDAWQADGWARVPAEVLAYEHGHVQYRYELQERVFLGHRIGIAAIENDEGNAAVGSRIQQALNDKAPLEVLVDPDAPSNSVVDTTIPWTMVIGFLPFAIGFGAVGLGAVAVMVATVLPDREEEEGEAINSDAAAGFFALAFFTLLWNSIAFPIAAVMVVELWNKGEWLGLLVLLFPLIGLLLVWGTVNSALNWIRRGGATLHPQHMPPRLGSVFSGHVSFKRGVTAGDAYKARLSCTSSGSKSEGTITHWSAEQQLRIADVGGHRRAAIRFDPPDRIPGHARDAETQWQLDLFPEGSSTAAFTFPFKMKPPAGVEHLPEEELEPALLDDEDEDLVPAGVPKGLEGVAAIVGKERIEEKMAAMPAAQRASLQARLDQMTPEQKAALAKVGQYAHYMPLVKKLAFWAIGLFILIQVIGVVSVLLFSS
jgi:hypothetical protein